VAKQRTTQQKTRDLENVSGAQQMEALTRTIGLNTFLLILLLLYPLIHMYVSRVTGVLHTATSYVGNEVSLSLSPCT
jgi:hypothetical protein